MFSIFNLLYWNNESSFIWHFGLTETVTRENVKFCDNSYKTWFTTKSVRVTVCPRQGLVLGGTGQTSRIVNQTRTPPLGASLSAPLALLYFCSIDKCCVKQPQTIILQSVIWMQLCTVKQTNITDLFLTLARFSNI